MVQEVFYYSLASTIASISLFNVEVLLSRDATS